MVSTPVPRALVIATMQHRLQALERALKEVGWQVSAHQDPRKALDELRHSAIGLVVCDSMLRGASPSGFLAWSRRLDPKRPFLVVASGDERHDLNVSGVARGPDGSLAFPPDLASLPQPTGSAPRKSPITEVRDLPMEGSTSLVPLPDLMEMLALTQESAVIGLHTDGQSHGSVWLDKGVLVHVEAHGDEGDSGGVRGLAMLLAGPASDFHVNPYASPPRRTVHTPTAAALTEAARLVDEQQRDNAILRSVLEAVPDALGLAVGYPLNEAPAATLLEGAAAFGVATTLLDQARGSVGNATHLAVEGERHAYAALRYGEGSVAVGMAPRGRSLVLISALAKAVKRSSR